jgi:adenosylhomocysteine nucleosidase
MSRIAIVAALEREVRPLIRQWRVSKREHAGRTFRFFENDGVVLVCGGMGMEAARRATEAVIALYGPSVVYSAGFAGALDPGLKVGEVFLPRRVVNASDGSSISLEPGNGVLVSFGSVASPEQKVKLRESFAAQAVDMEAAAVARAAETRGVEFVAVKAISEDSGFRFPSLAQYVDSNGRFLEARFALCAAMRPWLWPRVVQLARGSGRASRALCAWLQNVTLHSASASGGTLEAVNRR